MEHEKSPLDSLIQNQQILSKKTASAQDVLDHLETPGWIEEHAPKAVKLRLSVENPLEWAKNITRVGRVRGRLREVIPGYQESLQDLSGQITKARGKAQLAEFYNIRDEVIRQVESGNLSSRHLDRINQIIDQKEAAVSGIATETVSGGDRVTGRVIFEKIPPEETALLKTRPRARATKEQTQQAEEQPKPTAELPFEERLRDYLTRLSPETQAALENCEENFREEIKGLLLTFAEQCSIARLINNWMKKIRTADYNLEDPAQIKPAVENLVAVGDTEQLKEMTLKQRKILRDEAINKALRILEHPIRDQIIDTHDQDTRDILIYLFNQKDNVGIEFLRQVLKTEIIIEGSKTDENPTDSDPVYRFEGIPIVEKIVSDSRKLAEDKGLPETLVPELLQEEPKDPYADIKGKDPDIENKISSLTQRVLDTGRDSLSTMAVVKGFKVPMPMVAKALQGRYIETTTPGSDMLSRIQVIRLLCYRSLKFNNRGFNITQAELKQLNKLINEIAEEMIREYDRQKSKTNHKK